MKCNYCVEEIENFVCPTHGTVCAECLGICGKHESLCFRCEARHQGKVCVRCGSPWIYMITWEERHLCKVCVYREIDENGYDVEPAPPVVEEVAPALPPEKRKYNKRAASTEGRML